MDFTIFLAVVVFIAVVAVLSIVGRRRDRNRLALRQPDDGMQRGLEKIGYLIEHCRGSLDATKLRHGNDKYTHYYVGYVYEVARCVAEDEGAAFSTAFQMPVLLEAIRLCGGDRQKRGDRLIPAILASPSCQLGIMDGRIDAAESKKPHASGPYWGRIHAYFEDVRSDA